MYPSGQGLDADYIPLNAGTVLAVVSFRTDPRKQLQIGAGNLPAQIDQVIVDDIESPGTDLKLTL